jgi:hypothetical protein
MTVVRISNSDGFIDAVSQNTSGYIACEDKKILKGCIRNYFIEQLVEKKGLNADQRNAVEQQIRKLSELACYNLSERNVFSVDSIGRFTLNPNKELRNALPKGGYSVSIEKVRKVADEMIKMTVAIGNPYPAIDLLPKEETLLSPLFRFLLSVNLPNLFDALRWKVVKAILFKRNPEFLDEARNKVQHVLIELYKKLQENPKDNPLTFEATIAYLLSIYPHLGPNPGEMLLVPQYIQGKWHLCNYTVERIQLTPNAFGSPLYAYGLAGTYTDEQGAHKAPPNLLFKGTTYPTDDGAFLSILTDINPFRSVGEYAFQLGRKNIQAWFNREVTEDNKARLNGLSLGGALVSITAEMYPDKIELAHAYNPPALRNGLINNVETDAKVRVLWQNRDVISLIGSRWNPKWEIIDILGENSYNPLSAHAKGFAAEKDMIMVQLNNHRVNESGWRKVLTGMYYTVSVPAFCILALVYIVYRCFCELGVMLSQIPQKMTQTFRPIKTVPMQAAV